jgi:glucuronate isomerase
MNSEAFSYFYQLFESMPVVSSHEHIFPDEFQQGLTLDRL